MGKASPVHLGMITFQRSSLIKDRSSGIQILAAIQPVVGHLTTFIRSPTYVWGRPAPAYSAEQIEDFSKKPETLLALRRANEVHSNSVFSK